MITRDFLITNHADLVEAFRAEGRDAGLITGRQEGAAAECARIKGVLAVSLPGHEKLVNTLAFDGKTTGPEAAAQVLQAEQKKLGKTAEDLAADAAVLNGKPAPTPAADPAAAAAPVVDPNLPIEERCEKEWNADAKLRGEFTDLAAYTAFKKAESGGRVKILGKQKAA